MSRQVIFPLSLSLSALLCCGIVGAQSSPGPQSPAGCPEMEALRDRLKRAESYLNDWPNLGRYREANARLGRPGRKERRVVFMGDSITDFWDHPGYGGFFPGKPYVNRGISGQTTPQMLIRFRPDVIALEPKVVVILAGTNDIAVNAGPKKLSSIEDHISSMAELARAHNIRVVLASLLPVNDYKFYHGKQLVRTIERPPAQIVALNGWLKQYAARNGHTYLDYYTAVVDDKGMLKEDLTDDGVHPNSKGYAVMTPLAEEAIRRALNKD